MKRQHHRPTSPLRFGPLGTKVVLAGLSVLLAFAAVYVQAEGTRIVLAFASGIGVGAVMCLAARSSSLAQRLMP